MAMTTAQESNRWDVGMPFPAGVRKQITKYGEQVGAGQLSSPAAIWTCIPPPENQAPKEAIEDMVQRVAVMVGATHARIRSTVHKYGFAYDGLGNRITVFNEHGEFENWRFIRKDAHITVDFGFGEDHVAVHGHVYVKADDQATPTGLMDVGTRKHICEGDERILELWKQADRRNRPSIGHNESSLKRPCWQEEFLIDHYCRCEHRDVGLEDDHYCPCPHIKLLEVDHYCPLEPCPHRLNGFAKEVFHLRIR